MALLLLTGCGKKEASIEKASLEKNLQASAKNGARIAQTFYQPAPSHNSAFQALIDQAQPGDEIVLQAGDHYIVNPIIFPVGKNGVTIRGEDNAIVRKAPNGGQVGIIIWGNNNTIHHVELDGGTLPESGIMIYGADNKVTDSDIHHCGNAGILLHNGAGPSCVRNIVEGCTIFLNAHVGVSQSGHCDGRIAWCQIYQNGYEGITIDAHSDNNVTDHNLIADNNTGCAVGGIGIDGSNGNDITNNTIRDNKCRSGITFQNNLGGCDGTIVTGNTIINNAEWGILEIWTRYRNTNSLFASNTISGNPKGPHHVIQ